MVIERGRISSMEGDRARVTVPERDGAVTLPLAIGGGAMAYRIEGGALVAEPPEIGALVAFCEYPDGEGVILARLEN